MALLSLAGGLVLGYREIVSNGSPPAPQHIGIIQQQSGSGSGNVAGVQGNVTINGGATSLPSPDNSAEPDAQALKEFREHNPEILKELSKNPELANDGRDLSRSEERRVGKECRSRW